MNERIYEILKNGTSNSKICLEEIIRRYAVRIAKLLGSDRFRRPWVVSYDNAEEIKEMYAYATPYAYGLNYTAQRRYTGSEVMFFSKRIQAPLQTMEKIAA